MPDVEAGAVPAMAVPLPDTPELFPDARFYCSEIVNGAFNIISGPEIARIRHFLF